jgi:hypothetical protein
VLTPFRRFDLVKLDVYRLLSSPAISGAAPAICWVAQNGTLWSGSMDRTVNLAEAGGSGGGALRVFLSHTSELGKPDEKGSFVAAAVAAVQRARHAATDMAYFAARDISPAEDCIDIVTRSDVYVGIIGVRYGSQVSDRPGVSYTELEYETATKRGLPRLIFLIHADSTAMPPATELPELRARQDAFRARLMNSGLTAVQVIYEGPPFVKLEEGTGVQA